MNKDTVLCLTQKIFRDIFDDDELIIHEMMTANDINDWDSLNHINLISAVEKEFKVKFTLGELRSLKDVGALIDLVMVKTNQVPA